MFGTIRKHQGWLWWIIIVIVVTSFVVFFAPSSKFDNSRQRRGDGEYHGAIDGKEIGDGEWREAQREAFLRYFLMHGEWPDRETLKSGFSPDEQTYQQLLLIRKLEQLNIEPDPVSVAQAADNVMRQFNQGKPVDVATFVRQVLGSNVGMDDFERFIRHDVAIRQLVSIIGLSGELVTPAEAKTVYERERRERATQAVFFSASNYINAVTVTPAALGEFYTNRMSLYRLNERRQVSYVAFGFSNYLAQAEKDVTNLTQIVETNMQQLGTNYIHVAKTPEEARTRIRNEVLRRRALGTARQAANEFARPLFEMTPQRPESLAELAKTNGLTVKITEPFDENSSPEGLDVGQEFTKAAFSLSPTEEPFRGPVMGEDAAYVIAFARHLPEENPPFEKVRERVTADFKLDQARRLAEDAGSKFAQAGSAAVEQGKGFAEVCAANKVKPVAVPPLSVATRELPEVEEHLNLQNYKELAFGTPVGKVSGLARTPDGVALVYVEKELPIDVAKMQKDLPGFVNDLRVRRQQEAFYEWFNKQANQSLRRATRPAPQPAPGQPAPTQRRS
jgi:hypothetical protein